MKTLEVYTHKGDHKVFVNYGIDENSKIVHKQIGKILPKHSSASGYDKVTIRDENGVRNTISVARAMLSTFVGPPPTPKHTVDHISRVRNDDRLENLRWLCLSGQALNQTKKLLKKSFVIVHDGREMSAKDWAKEENVSLVSIYNRTLKNVDWKYKIYEDNPGEIWKKIEGSESQIGFWKCSNFGRAAFHKSEHIRNVFSPGELNTVSGYPSIGISGKTEYFHIVIFKTFHPEKWKNRNSDDIILHENDDKMDCRVEKLHLGSRKYNGKDAHDNGKYDGIVTVVIFVNNSVIFYQELSYQ
jgi:hypothetical protein